MSDESLVPCPHEDTWFDRTVCACGVMHTNCSDCGETLDDCYWRVSPQYPTTTEYYCDFVRALEGIFLARTPRFVKVTKLTDDEVEVLAQMLTNAHAVFAAEAK